MAKHAQQARRPTRVVRANGQLSVCSDDLGDGVLGRNEGSWEIRKEIYGPIRRKENMCRRGENRRPWKAEGGGLPLCDTCPRRGLWKGQICFRSGSRMREPTRMTSRPCWAGMDLVSPEDRSHISMLFSVVSIRTEQRFRWTSAFRVLRYGCGTPPHVPRSTCPFSARIFLGSLLQTTG